MYRVTRIMAACVVLFFAANTSFAESGANGAEWDVQVAGRYHLRTRTSRFFDRASTPYRRPELPQSSPRNRRPVEPKVKQPARQLFDLCPCSMNRLTEVA